MLCRLRKGRMKCVLLLTLWRPRCLCICEKTREKERKASTRDYRRLPDSCRSNCNRSKLHVLHSITPIRTSVLRAASSRKSATRRGGRASSRSCARRRSLRRTWRATWTGSCAPRTWNASRRNSSVRKRARELSTVPVPSALDFFDQTFEVKTSKQSTRAFSQLL